MSKNVLKVLENIKPGDLICVDWLDASRGRIETMRELREVGSSGAIIDSPVKSYGVFIGLFGRKSKHIVLVASLWVFTAVADYGQVDSTIIPLGCVEGVRVVQLAVLDVERVKLCMSAFLQGRCYHYHRRFQFKGRTFEVNRKNVNSS
jgi:hypothetical protein